MAAERSTIAADQLTLPNDGAQDKEDISKQLAIITELERSGEDATSAKVSFQRALELRSSCELNLERFVRVITRWDRLR